MKITGALASTADRLSNSHTAEPRIEAEVLLRYVLGMERAAFFASVHECLTPNQDEQLCQLVQRRVDGEPLAYILGRREFYGLDFVVNHHAFIPRQETELLVDKVLELCSARRAGEPFEVIDVGTGCGAIAVAVAFNLPGANVYATDISREALQVADINRRQHGVKDRVHLIQGDLFEAIDRPVDVIVSNPPYIKTSDLSGLAIEVRREPALALHGGDDGLAIIRRLLRQALARIRPGGCILVEIAPEQLHQAMDLARDAFPAGSVSFARDLLHLPRMVAIKLP